MDSIANHPSALRALQKSSSKSDLTKTDSNTKTPKSLKRTQSKMDIIESMPKAPTSALKRTQSKMDLAESSTTKIIPTPLKRTQSKADLTSSSLPRAQSTVRVVQASRDGPTKEDNPFVKRVKRTEADDAGTARPASRDGVETKTSAPAPTPARKTTGLPRLASRLMTPTKSSIARAQSAKTLKSQSMIPGKLDNLRALGYVWTNRDEQVLHYCDHLRQRTCFRLLAPMSLRQRRTYSHPPASATLLRRAFAMVFERRAAHCTVFVPYFVHPAANSLRIPRKWLRARICRRHPHGTAMRFLRSRRRLLQSRSM